MEKIGLPCFIKPSLGGSSFGVTKVKTKEQIQSQGLQIAVASNKYQAATQKLIAHYFPKIHFVAVFGKREGVNVKPDPTIVEDILTITGIQRQKVDCP